MYALTSVPLDLIFPLVADGVYAPIIKDQGTLSLAGSLRARSPHKINPK
jgi:hypothetical protein